MRKLLLLLAVVGCAVITAQAEDSDWKLYFWSDASNAGGDAGTFQTGNTDGVFVLEGITTTETGLKFCVHNSAWSVQYGWSTGSEGSVLATGVDVPLGVTSSASGWLGLPAGDYDITFNLNDKTIRFDDAVIEAPEYPISDLAEGDYLRGGDVSMLTYVESMGAKFYTADGVESDPLDIMKDNGVNIVRLRLYNNPGTAVTYGGNTYKVPAGYLDEADVLRLARRCKAKGLRVELTFHYSDFWTNGMTQFKPKDWQSLTMAELKTAVYDYTKQFLQKMRRQGTTPEYVSLGNEIQNGMLFGYNSSSGRDAVSGYVASDEAALLAEGSKAVREVCPDSKIIIHLTMNSNWKTSRYVSFFTNMKTANLDYDIIGASYYPFYTNDKPSTLSAMANTLYSSFGKDMMIMEVGYSWTQYRPSGRNGGNYMGQLELNGTPYNEASEAGQKSFMQEVNAVVKGNDHILGYLYWDPVMVDQKVNGSWIETAWAYRQDGSNWWQDGNVVSNTTWFDYEGKALPVFEAIKEDAPTGIDGPLPTTTADAEAGGTVVYDLTGRRVSQPVGGGIYIKEGRKFFVK